MTPVELIRLARLEQQRDKHRHAVTWILAQGFRPAPRIAPERIVRTFETLAQQQVVDPPQPIAPMPRFVLRQQCIEMLLEGPDPRQRLNRTMIVKCALSPDRLAHHLS